MSLLRIRSMLCSTLLVLLPMGAAHASCDVTGGGPIVAGSEVICSGYTAGSVLAPAVTDVTVVVMPGATLDASAGTRAIQLGRYANVTVHATALVVATPGDPDIAVVSTAADSIVSVAGTVRALGPGRTMVAGLNSVVSVSGSIDGEFGSAGALYLFQQGSTAGYATDLSYLSSAGTVNAVVLAPPLWFDSEFYNEPGGQIQAGVLYPGEGLIFGIPTLMTEMDLIVVNRGRIGAFESGYALQSANHRLANVQFSNEANGVVQGDVQLLRSYQPDKSRGSNHGSIEGRVVLSVPTTDGIWGVPYGYPQRFENHGSVRGIEAWSGQFVQVADASFSITGSLRVAGESSNMLHGTTPGHFYGTLGVAGVQQTGCLLGRVDEYTIGGVIDLQAAATLTVAPVGAQSCRFDGVLVGAGRLVKQGTGEQVVGALPPPLWWQTPRPPTSYSGGTSLVAGTLAATTSDAFGTGPVSFDGANARLRFDAEGLVLANELAFNASAVIDTNRNVATLSGPSSGSAPVRKTSPGTLHWPGVRAHTGTTTVDAGTLRFDSSVAGAVTAAEGGTLAGSATVAGALVLQPGSTLQLAIDGASNDRFVAPTATVAGATLALDAIAPAAIGHTIELVDVTGAAPVSGVFDNVAEGGFLHDGDTGYRLSYVGGDGNDITLTAVRVPLPPNDVVATPGNAQLSLGFTAPAANGSGAVTGYRAQCMPGNVSVDAAQSPIIVTGLSNGVPYACSVRTLAAAGPSAASATVVATPLTVASAPNSVVVSAGVSSFSIAFAAPTDNGGSPVTGYRLGCEPGALVTTAVGSPLGFSGLVNGTQYSCTLAAITDVGTGQAATFSVVPRTVPDVPLNLAGIGYNGEIRFSFDPPAFDGGAPITSYRVRCSPGATRIVSGPSSPLTLTGQSNGQTLTCRVRASNVAGNGAESADISVAARAVPSEVRNAFVVDSDAAAAIAFDAPTLGAPILDYSATCEPGGLVFTQATSPLIAIPLINDTVYDCSVSARNAIGSGPPVDITLRPSDLILESGFE